MLTRSLRRNARQRPESLATIDGDRRRTWTEAVDRVARFAGGLTSLGVAAGQRVGILAPNGDYYFDYLYGCWWAAAVINPVNTRWSVQEIAYSLDDSSTELLFIHESFADRAADLLERSVSLRHIIPVGCEAYENWLTTSSPVAEQERDANDLAAILYTGGTTGFPKGVMLTHRSITASALGVASMPGCQATNCYLHVPPLFHIGALSGVIIAMLAGSTNVFVRGFEPQAVLEAIEREKVSELFLVPTMLKMLLDDPAFGRFDLGSLRLIRYGASTIDDELLDRCLEAFPGVGFVQAYGMTELSPVATILTPADHQRSARASGKLRTAGRATPVVDVRIAGADGKDMPAGQVGEIIVRGDTVMLGVKRRSKGTPDRRRRGTPFSDNMMLVC